MADVGDSGGHACAFLAKKQDIFGHKGEIIGRLLALCGEQQQPSGTDGGLESAEIGMACDRDMIDIVHGRSADASIIPREPHGLDKVHSRAKTGAKAQNGANVSSNFWFKKGNTHGV